MLGALGEEAGAARRGDGPGLRPGPRSRERGACPSAAGVCGLRAASGFPGGVAAQLGGISAVGLLPEAGKGAAPASCFELLGVLGFFPPPQLRFFGSLLYYLCSGYLEDQFHLRADFENVPRGNTVSPQSPFAIIPSSFIDKLNGQLKMHLLISAI